MNKKGLEIAIGFIVTLLITVLIFGLALFLLFKWFGSSQQLEQQLDKQTEDQILTTLRTGNELVVIPFTVREATRGNFATFGLGVRNIISQQQFSASLHYSGAFNPDGSRITSVDDSYITTHWLGNFATLASFGLKKNEQDVRPLVIKADLNIAPSTPTPKGDYVFNVCVFANQTTTPDCTLERLTNEPIVYSGKIYQVTVRVV